ncbi:MAG: ASCH domain-containing protein [Bacteroides sp.]|nr:ASCH domain-containing protein [Bacteroides sp.]
MKTDNKKYLFISVKPEFANKIIKKEKTIELRKMKPDVKMGDYIIIYASAPSKSVIGYGVIKQIIEKEPRKMWEDHFASLGIDKEQYFEYYNNKNKAIGIEIDEIKEINPISLDNLRKIDPDFHPPQIYKYVSNIEICRTILEFVQK